MSNDKLELFVEFIATKRSTDGSKTYSMYRVFGTPTAIALYQSRLRKPMWSQRSGFPLFMTAFAGPRSGMLSVWKRKDGSWAMNIDDSEYRRLLGLAERHKSDPELFKYYLEKASTLTVEIPESLRNIQWQDETAIVEGREYTETEDEDEEQIDEL
jgi:hypothetical protein